MFDFDQQTRDFINNNQENIRNRELVNSILALAETQRQSNLILEKQCNELQTRNDMLKKELEESRQETKRAVLFNIISSAIAFASLVATILIAVFL